MFQRIRRFFFRTNIRTRLLFTMLIISVPPLVGAIIYSVYTARGLIYDYTLSEQEYRLHTRVVDVERFLSNVQEDTIFLSQLEALADLSEASSQQDAAEYERVREALERELLAFSQAHDIYDQVRFLDASGMEIVRVDSDGSRSFVIPSEELQDKSGRYYFGATMLLSLGEVFVSPVDLTVEHGQLERPFNPVIRYASPVWHRGRRIGIVILNVFADRFLDALEVETELSETVVLVDQDGYYLYHSTDEDKRWGRDLGTGITLAQDYPELAEHIAAGEREEGENEPEQVGDEFLLYTFLSPPGTSDYRWGLISILPKDVALVPVYQFQWTVLVIASISLVLLVGLGFLSSTRFVDPIRRLESLAVNLGEGDLETEIALEGVREIEALAQAFDRARIALLQTYRNLEDQVKQVERRAIQLHTAAQVSSSAAAILDPQELLAGVVSLITERFDFHAGIFLVDASGEWAVLRAASSSGGRRMLARGHRLRVGEQGIVGYVVFSGRPRIALDVGEDAVHFVNPDLPDTRSEMALPLRAHGQVIGALDVQSVKPEAFTDEDVEILQTMADQIALAISNAQLFQEQQQGAEALQRAYGEYSYEAWARIVRAQKGLGYRYAQKTLTPAGELWRPEMAQAMQEGRLVEAGNEVEGEEEQPALAVPIRVRDRVIGVIDVCKPEGSGGWTQEEFTLLESLTDQLGMALDSARSHQETQSRAAREELIGEIATRMRETLDMETILQTTIREIGKALKVDEVEVRMGLGDQYDE